MAGRGGTAAKRKRVEAAAENRGPARKRHPVTSKMEVQAQEAALAIHEEGAHQVTCCKECFQQEPPELRAPCRLFCNYELLMLIHRCLKICEGMVTLSGCKIGKMQIEESTIIRVSLKSEQRREDAISAKRGQSLRLWQF